VTYPSDILRKQKKQYDIKQSILAHVTAAGGNEKETKR
jgi:hypothetical protein